MRSTLGEVRVERMTPRIRRVAVLLTLALTVVLVLGFAVRGHATVGLAAEPGVDRRIADSRITESSGLAASHRHRGVLYTHNDSGDSAQIFAIAPDGSTAATFTLASVTPRDWEAISSSVDSSGKAWLWVADIGDNNALRSNGILVHRLAEPARLSSATIPAASLTSYRLRYPDGPHNAEALLVHPRTGRLYVVTKQVFGAQIYQAPATLSSSAPNVLQAIPAQGLPGLVTDGTFLPDGRVALLTWSSTITIVSDLQAQRPHLDTVEVQVPRVRLPANGSATPTLQAAQVESLAVSVDGRWLYVGTEGQDSPIVRVAVPDPTSASVREKALDTASAAVGHTTSAVTSTARWSLASPWRVAAVGAGVLALLAILTARRRRRRRGQRHVVVSRDIGGRGVAE